MSSISNGVAASALADADWIKSRRSGPTGGNCVEVALLADGEVAVRNSRHPDGPALVFTGGRRVQPARFGLIRGCPAGSAWDAG
jgi:hypothetical protein